MSRISRPKNAAPNTIFTSFAEDGDGLVGVIRYSGEPIPVLAGARRFQVPVAWGYLGSGIGDPTSERDWFPNGSCLMSAKQRKALPRRVRDAENLIAEDGSRTGTVKQAYTVWFEYLLDEASKP